MANSLLGTRPLLSEPSHGTGRLEPVPFASALALTITLATAAFLLLTSFVWVVHPPGHLPGVGAAGGDQNQHTKTALYLIGFFVLLPATLFVASRITDAITGGPSGRSFPALVALLVTSLAVVILLVRLSGVVGGGGGTRAMLPGMAVWCAGAAVILVRALRPEPSALLLKLARWSTPLAVVAGVAVFGLVLSVTALKSVHVLPLVLGLLATAAVLYMERRRLPRPSRRLGIGIDVVAGLVLILAIPNLFIFNPGSYIPNWLTTTGIMQFHQDLLLGPTNQVMHGGVLLVNSPPSQYGIGSVYFLAAWFHLAPIGYGTYGFLDGALTALYYLAAYGIVRMAGVRRPLAAGAFALAVVALVYNLKFPPGALPQQGPIRFGMPMALLLPMVAAARWPHADRPFRVAALVVLGISSVWALEGVAYTLFTYAAIVAVEVCLLSAGRLRLLRRRVLEAIAAIVCAHVIFAVATLAVGGSLPHWGRFAAFVHAFLFGGEAGSITFGFARWSPGVAVGALYFASAAGIALLVARRRELAVANRVAMIAITGATAAGVALYSYFDNRSATYLILYLALPALMTATLWISLLRRKSMGVSRPARLGGLAFALCVAVLLLSTAWPSIGGRFMRTPLAEAFPGGHGLRTDIHRLWHPPPFDPRSADGERVLARFMPGQRHVLAIVSPDLGVETLMRSKRANLLPMGDPIEDSFVLSSRLPVLRSALDKIRPGQRMLLDATSWKILQAVRADPSLDPTKAFRSTLQTPIQGWLLAQLNRRFRIVPIYFDRHGFIVARLAQR